MASTQTRWQIAGDYFENCNCDVVCPCLFSPNAPLTSQPTAGACEIALGFHIDQGSYGSATLNGLNVAMIVRTPGPMAEGNWSVALYLDELADEQQRQALQAIFTGSVGGPFAALAPLISTVLGVKTAPITFRKEGKSRSVEIPSIMQLAVHAVPSINPDEEIWAKNAHFIAPSVALAVGDEKSTWEDYGMRWDNAGKNAHYAPINWSST
ncbi:hypothetical protein KSC_018720 [Ktedonobacter sp. SOSP1-52]|uniref:DUF1326 domain-containing protein n=1 Tax=Ktedonobacter sp. SOSP1-52 TaxID=2778366 RepID=UPI0019163B74|nr:DUF1326 domain-containing protein [Ktedonobacter sp. SOSP1-52]GHO62980.1 hypothetical protein KSC_018720 [Ktedonobacter sp. SOSP1-52]